MRPLCLNLRGGICWCFVAIASCFLSSAGSLAQPPRGSDARHWILDSYARVNVGLARRACQLTPDEEAQLQKLDEQWIKEQLGPLLNLDIQLANEDLLRFKQQVRGQAVANPQLSSQQLMTRIKQTIDEHIQAALTPEHLAAYQTERAARERFRKLALTEVLVAVIDRRVFLSAEQREQLQLKVAAWLSSDLVWQIYFQDVYCVPDLPRSMLHEVLTPEQINCLNGVREVLVERESVELKLMRSEPVMMEP